MSSKLLPIYDMQELQELFGYTNQRALRAALRSKRLPLKMFRLNGVRVCHQAVVEEWFEQMKRDGMAALEDHTTGDT